MKKSAKFGSSIHHHPPKVTAGMAGGTKAIPSPTKTPQRAVAASKRTSTGKAISGGATFPQAYEGPAVPSELHSLDLPAMSPYKGSEAFAPSDAHPVRTRHRMGGEG